MSGGGGSSTPSSQTVTQTTIPEYARPYVEKSLGQAATLTDISDNPYQSYQGERFAQFTPLQQQSYAGAENMQTSPQTGLASGIAGAAGLGALNAAGSFNPYQTGQFTGSTAASYMNPYMQNVVDIQQREAARKAGIAGTQQQSQATKAGAFGGGRDAIMRAEAARNLATQQGDIQAQGLHNAYNQAQQQFNTEQQLGEQSKQYGAGFGLQGLSTALQGAQALGALGQQQFQQGMDINKLQNAYGGQQQGQVQNILTSKYQDFLNEQNDPYKRLSFMSDILRGGPLSQTYKTDYAAGPSAAQTLGSLGTAAYGLSKLAHGGSVHMAGGGFAQPSEPVVRMAGGGRSVTDPEFVDSSLSKLSNQQLQKVKQDAVGRRDVDLANKVDAILAQRAEQASMSQGIAGAAPENMEDMLPTEVSARNGGILAFSKGSPGKLRTDIDDANMDTGEGGGGEGEFDDDDRGGSGGIGDAAAYADFLKEIGASRKRIADTKYEEFSPAKAAQVRNEYLERVNKDVGPDPYEARNKQLQEERSGLDKQLEQGKGLAALQAAGAMLQGRGIAQGLGNAASAYGGAYGEALKAHQAQKQALSNMEFNLADARRKERMGLNREADAAEDRARKDHSAAQTFGLKKEQLIGDLAGKGAMASRPQRPLAPPRPQQPHESATMIATLAAKIKATNPDMDPVSVQAMATEQYLRMTKAGTAPAGAQVYKDATKAVDDQIQLRPSAFKKLVSEKYGGDEAKARTDMIAQHLDGSPLETLIPTTGKPLAPAAAANPAIPRPSASSGATLKSKVEAAGQVFNPNKFEYRILEDGSVQRKAKG